MELRLKGTRYEPTEEIKAQVETKVLGLARFLDESEAQAYASVELERAVGGQQKGDVWRAEVQVTHQSGEYRAESTKTKLDHALTTAVRDVAREMSRARKRDDRRRKSGGKLLKALFRGIGD